MKRKGNFVKNMHVAFSKKKSNLNLFSAEKAKVLYNVIVSKTEINNFDSLTPINGK